MERIVPGTSAWTALYPEHIQRYQFVAERLASGARVLDAGCGVGYGAAFLADHSAGSVVAVDISTEAIAIARREFPRDSVTWIREDCHTLVAAGAHAPFDLICNLENLEHLAEPQRFLTRVTEMLSPRGLLITSTPNRIGVNRLRGVTSDARSTNPFHHREYTVEEFRELLQSFFEDVTLHFQTFDPLERMHLEPVLSALWNNPASRLGRWLQRTLRGRPVVEHLEDLLPPHKYQILSANPGDPMVITQIAVCRTPRRHAT